MDKRGSPRSSLEYRITCFSVPKAFKEKIGVIQRNALRSWIALGPGVEVLLFGDDEGVASEARNLNITHVRDVEKSELGTPLLKGVFQHAAAVSRADILCYVNADIVLFPNFLRAISEIQLERFLAVGRRWDLDLEGEVDLSNSDQSQSVHEQVRSKGVLHPPTGSDYFVFPRKIDWRMPDFAVGRPGWDNWLIYQARAMKVPVVDISEVVTVVHQNHDYAHVPGGTDAWEGPEAIKNRELMGGERFAFTLLDATHRLTGDGLRRTSDWAHLRRKLQAAPILHPRVRPLFRALALLRGR